MLRKEELEAASRHDTRRAELEQQSGTTLEGQSGTMLEGQSGTMLEGQSAARYSKDRARDEAAARHDTRRAELEARGSKQHPGITLETVSRHDARRADHDTPLDTFPPYTLTSLHTRPRVLSCLLSRLIPIKSIDFCLDDPHYIMQANYS